MTDETAREIVEAQIKHARETRVPFMKIVIVIKNGEIRHINCEQEINAPKKQKP